MNLSLDGQLTKKDSLTLLIGLLISISGSAIMCLAIWIHPNVTHSFGLHYLGLAVGLVATFLFYKLLLKSMIDTHLAETLEYMISSIFTYALLAGLIWLVSGMLASFIAKGLAIKDPRFTIGRSLKCGVLSFIALLLIIPNSTSDK